MSLDTFLLPPVFALLLLSVYVLWIPCYIPLERSNIVPMALVAFRKVTASAQRLKWTGFWPHRRTSYKFCFHKQVKPLAGPIMVVLSILDRFLFKLSRITFTVRKVLRRQCSYHSHCVSNRRTDTGPSTGGVTVWIHHKASSKLGTSFFINSRIRFQAALPSPLLMDPAWEPTSTSLYQTQPLYGLLISTCTFLLLPKIRSVHYEEKTAVLLWKQFSALLFWVRAIHGILRSAPLSSTLVWRRWGPRSWVLI